ncbi:hypothetical protein CEXT_272921 [Caerostris extrusa]|uniref:Uncharacterized protein n=1 Tax=Caerostris extrusa TaxID=172846 RepID=A0AAV4U9G3_CAEEX|nr:hypothetical protein CEXT_272921 [Caerostris extrusa]
MPLLIAGIKVFKGTPIYGCGWNLHQFEKGRGGLYGRTVLAEELFRNSRADDFGSVRFLVIVSSHKAHPFFTHLISVHYLNNPQFISTQFSSQLCLANMESGPTSYLPESQHSSAQAINKGPH